jgi:riboflavin-specific deaminase-like protein
VELRRLFPDQATVTIDDAVAGVRFSERAPAGRPYIALNMVATADGRATLAGRTAPMSAPADREVFHRLRTRADGVLVGAGTARVERYRPLTKTPELQAARSDAGVRANAAAVVVSGRLDVPADIPLLSDPASDVFVVTTSSAELEDVAANVTYLRMPLPDALAQLREEHDIRSLLCEGGPILNASLFANALVDELFLTVAPVIAGVGEALTIVEGAPLPGPALLELVSVHEAGGHLFLRYRVG